MRYRLRKKLCIALLFFSAAGSVLAEETIIPENTEKPQHVIPARITRKIRIPKGYHEGLFLDGERIWVNNGEGGKTWVIDLKSGNIVSEIEPVATFSEGITAAPGGRFWITDWISQKLYLVAIENNKMKAESEISFAPSYPTGVVWTGNSLYVIVWARGTGTKYYLIKMDADENILQETRIKGIREPSQLAWDGKNLWISSWFDRRVYKINMDTVEAEAYFRTRIEDTTGIAWDGKSFWVTGSKANLYQIETESKD